MQQQQQQQKACSGKMPEMSSSSLNPPLPHQQRQVPNPQIQLQHYQSSHFDQSTQSHEDFFDHLLSNLPPSSCWPELSSNPKSPFLSLLSQSPTKLRDLSDDANLHLPSDDSSLLAARLRQHQITGGAAPVAWSGIPSPPRKLLQQQPPLFLPKGGGGGSSSGIARFPLAAASDPDSSDSVGEGAIQGLFSNGMAASLPRTAQTGNQPQIQQPQNYGAPAAGINQGQAAGTAGAPAKQRVRAKRGQATDPHSIAERLRRERIAERMKALQELVPNANKTDKASMLDEIIDYVKFLQLQVKVLSMSRLGGAAAAAPLMADISSQPSCMERTTNGVQTASCNDSLTVTENQVAKLMEQDMGSAMQYLQGKGLCLMPITLASAISTAPSSHSRAHASLLGAADAPSSPSMSVLTAQSAMGNGGGETSVKDAASVSKP